MERGLTTPEQLGYSAFEIVKNMSRLSRFDLPNLHLFSTALRDAVNCHLTEAVIADFGLQIKQILKANEYRTESLYENSPAGENLLKNSNIGYLVYGLTKMPEEAGMPVLWKFFKKSPFLLDEEVAIAYGFSTLLEIAASHQPQTIEINTRIDQDSQSEFETKLIDAMTFDRNGFYREDVMKWVKIYGRWLELAGGNPADVIDKLLSESPYRSFTGSGFVLNKYGPERSRRYYDTKIFIYGLMALQSPEAQDILLKFHQKLQRFGFRNENERLIFLRNYYAAVGFAQFQNKDRLSNHLTVKDEEIDVLLSQVLDFAPMLTKLNNLRSNGDPESAKKLLGEMKQNGFKYNLEIKNFRNSLNTRNKLLKLIFMDSEFTNYLSQAGIENFRYFGEGEFTNVKTVLTVGADVQDFRPKTILFENLPPQGIYFGIDPSSGILIFQTLRMPGELADNFTDTILRYLKIKKFDETHVNPYHRNEALPDHILILDLKRRFLDNFQG